MRRSRIRARSGTDGNIHLAVELHVANPDSNSGASRLDRIDAFGGIGTAPLASYSATELETRDGGPDAGRPGPTLPADECG